MISNFTYKEFSKDLSKKLRIVTDYKASFELFFRLIKSAEQNLEDGSSFIVYSQADAIPKLALKSVFKESREEESYYKLRSVFLGTESKGNFEYSFCLSGNRVS
ncbi:hypothetical protein LEP1GSC062_3355 [Leptospira alexanderi serovar Manhao 3 str. L 60]|uniref:Uncharacterized protein n=1 Tax=Leptospira alexanderi serovar Manhao 3 str. L 60 TaxID=1049759 RepID=V6IDZ6_9LEPT|nr:hypothetical protein LEP1GSC062_3355 [Leptospira alexanderi serovar Manhao 3 str. L 60]